ncbi:MAG: hypothetical protein RBS88_02255 [Spongiibacteraceae bacterium]|jgi:hypothetical protein|nr:hypothetical protein [Spongiibacteraceae bacterium]
MVAWMALAKAVAPHVTTIVTAAIPAFTTRKIDDPEGQLALAQQQIAELQQAVTRNDAHIRELAEQLRMTVLALEEAGRQAQRRLWLALGASGMALVAAVAAIWLALR